MFIQIQYLVHANYFLLLLKMRRCFLNWAGITNTIQHQFQQSKKMAPSKAIKDAILGDVVVLIDEAHAEACAKGNSTYGITMIKEQQQDFPWINRNVIDYFKKVSHTTAIKHVRQASSTEAK